MKTANLLIDCDSLNFNSPDIDLSSSLEDFFLARDRARSSGDSLFNSPELWNMLIVAENQTKQTYLEIILNPAKTISIFPWLRQPHRQLLISLINYGRTTAKSSTNLGELEIEFVDENNGILGVGNNDTSKRVFDVASWFQLHSVYLKEHPEFINWESNNVLPLVAYSNLHLIESVERINESFSNDQDKLDFFRNSLIRNLRQDRGELIQFATEIATRNCYEKDSQLSSLETRLRGSQRLIFKINKEDSLQYISLDFENGQWEVSNENGEHLGVYNFSGEQTGEADNSGNHDILALRN